MWDGENLERFLQTVRYDGLRLWIDQICINQSDPNERSHQVQMVSRIYSQASQVLVWLGPKSDDSDFAIDALRGLRESYFSRTKSALKRLDHEEDQGLLNSVLALMSRPYWSRLWILQELILAKDLLIKCDAKEVKWRFLELLFEKTNFWKNYTPTFKQAQTIVRERQQPLSGRHLAVVLDRYSGWQCRDERDKVYGLLGLVTHPPNLIVDYKSKPSDLLFQVLAIAATDGTGTEHLVATSGGSKDIIPSLWGVLVLAHQLRARLKLYHVEVIVMETFIKTRVPDRWEAAIQNYKMMDSGDTPGDRSVGEA